MSEPAWDELEAGTMVRGALWLKQVVGEGNTFTKQQIAEAFPGVAQADRRIRDLRDHGWVIHTNTSDARLSAEAQRLVKIGAPVWDREARRASQREKPLSAKVRGETMERDGYMCRTCGITGGESYPDDPVNTAVLSVFRKEVVLPDGSRKTGPMAECKRCRSGSAKSARRLDKLQERIGALDEAAKRQLAQWMARDERDWSDLELLWSAYRALPPEYRDQLRAEVEKPD
ncbi:hypothetical protein LO763_10045 [Glycomyces sp. A-F 0318]|uniref:hypothetical protein n=1 Tax=Glycomyces amatae TaxID=2881355 RepID=UPI001E38E78C|nr:hypothetical protein [Glycomyces amatae]MCD0443964.1 hypothetical protein [Glycomyces amatae]